MQVVWHPSARAFLDATRAYRERAPLTTNLLASIAEGVVQGRAYEGEWWSTVTDADGHVVGAAVRTAPYNLVVGPMRDESARAVGEAWREHSAELPGVAGPDAVLGVLLPLLGRPWQVHMRDVLRVLTTLTTPETPPEGSLRRATPADEELLARWHREFLLEAGLPVLEEEVGAPRLRPGGGAVWIWEAKGVPAAMAGHAPVVETPGGRVGRIGPVYTVPGFRGRGIGTAATAGVARELLATCAHVMLFADADNATSNGVYERLGFAAVGEQVEVTLL